MEFNVKFKFGILGDSGVEDGLQIEDCVSGTKFYDSDNVLGWSKFVSHEKLFEHEQTCLSNECLTLVCEVSFAYIAFIPLHSMTPFISRS